MSWTVNVIEQAETELAELPRGLRAKLLALLKLIEEVGLLRMPAKRKRHLRGPIWELRVNALEGIARALYIAEGKEIAVLLGFAKKTEKTPSQLIEIAVKRSNEV